jgi:hypothetical protein
MNKIKYMLLFFVFIAAKAYSQCKTGDCNNGRGTYDFGWCIYTGEFKDGKPNGKGVMNYDDYSYEGDFKNGVEDGKGIITYKNGSRESAFYYRGTKQKQDKKIAAADWKELEGQYIECVSGNCITGFGTMQFLSGNKYVGNFLNRKREGKGVFYFNNGDKFEGTWNADLKTNGTYTFNNGYVYTGSFFNDDFYNGTFAAPSGATAIMENGAVQAPPQLDEALQSSGSIRKDIRSYAKEDNPRQMCMVCYGSGKIHETIYGGYKDKNGNTQFGAYSMCTACFGKGYK